MRIKGEDFLVYGLSVSGIASARLILSLGGRVSLFDDSKEACLRPEVQALIAEGCILLEEFSPASVVVVSPGVPIDNKNLVSAKAGGCLILGELELASILLKCPSVAVTGTNGKTTTATLIHNLLLKGGEPSRLLGNVGTPLSGAVLEMGHGDIAVIEVSSFQAETLRTFTPHIGVLLNVTEDHLDRHYTLDNYRFLKGRIFSNMRGSEWAVLNYDDPAVREIGFDLKCKKAWFSIDERVDGAYVEGGYIYCFGNKICPVDAFSLAGRHNLSNCLAAVLTVRLLGLTEGVIEEGLSAFSGVPHRIERVMTVGNVNYVNDSKATNVDSAVKCIEGFSGPTAVILGGVSKGQDYTDMFKTLKCRPDLCAVLLGQTKAIMLAAALKAGFTNIICADDLQEAVYLATAKVRSGGNVILSPAAASFDAFKDYRERGEEFRRIVRGLNEESLQG